MTPVDEDVEIFSGIEAVCLAGCHRDGLEYRLSTGVPG